MMRWTGQKARTAVIGGSEDGKTFLTSGFVRGHWLRDKLRAIVFDPWIGETDWGPSAWVTKDFEAFRRAIAGTTDCVVVWDEGTSWGGRDRENIELFTAIRHNHPFLYFIGHNYSTMLPVMRGSLTDVCLAVRDPDDADEWARIMVDEAVKQSTALRKYEFMHKKKHCPVRVLRHTAEQIKKGIYL